MTKVLVIDDNVAVRETIAQVLEEAGYQVVSVHDGKHGMATFRKELLDLVITDIILPEQEGIETMMLVRCERPTVPVIAISGGGRIGPTDPLGVARELGALAALAKPFDPDDLVLCGKQCLEGVTPSFVAS